jgi:polysaccharide biosynthesis/export protein
VKFLSYLSVLVVLCSCSSYKQNILFKAPKDFVPEPVKKEALHVEKNYIIQKNDYLKLDMFSNKGERIIDPNPDLSNNRSNQQNMQGQQQLTYLVDLNGVSKFPMVGELKVEGLTLRQAEEILQKEFEKYFKEPFVVLTYANKRVIVLGALGGQVIPLTNQNVNLVEVLALAKGLPNDAKANNIRILRDDQVFIVDLSTLEGFKQGNMLIQPGDIIYVEPIRRPFSEGLKDYAGYFSLLLSLATVIILVRTIK